MGVEEEQVRLELRPLLDAVAAGTGLAGIHAGLGDAFRLEVDFQFMVGGQWVAHPGDDGVTYTVQIADRAHPVAHGVDDFVVVSEKYYMHFDPAVHVIATTDFDGVAMPIAWTKPWGEGASSTRRSATRRRSSSCRRRCADAAGDGLGGRSPRSCRTAADGDEPGWPTMTTAAAPPSSWSTATRSTDRSGAPRCGRSRGRFRVVAPDLRGYGHSPATAGTVTMAELAATCGGSSTTSGSRRSRRSGLAWAGSSRSRWRSRIPSGYGRSASWRAPPSRRARTSGARAGRSPIASRRSGSSRSSSRWGRGCSGRVPTARPSTASWR